MRIVLAMITLLTTLTSGLAAKFVPEKFILPQDAKVLVVVEGFEDSKCRVNVYEKNENWDLKFTVDGDMGRNGMNNYRKMGDGTTPIGVWAMNTPFGQKPAQEGFPANYIQVNEDYCWTDDTNKLIIDPTHQTEGEYVGTEKYKGYYNYAIDCGYNINNVKNKGSALFIHCQSEEPGSSSGCIKIPEYRMIELMKLYGKYGDGKCYIAQAPYESIEKLYNTFGICNGLSPNGKF